MIIKETGLPGGRSYCTAEHMEIKQIGTEELNEAAKFYIEYIHRTPVTSWVFVRMNRETLCVNKAHRHAGRLAKLAGRFMELPAESEESNRIFNEIEKLGGKPASDALIDIWLAWRKERRDYKNHLAAVEYVEKMRAKLQDDNFIPGVDIDLLRAIKHIIEDAGEALMMVYLYGRADT